MIRQMLVQHQDNVTEWGSTTKCLRRAIEVSATNAWLWASYVDYYICIWFNFRAKDASKHEAALKAMQEQAEKLKEQYSRDREKAAKRVSKEVTEVRMELSPKDATG